MNSGLKILKLITSNLLKPTNTSIYNESRDNDITKLHLTVVREKETTKGYFSTIFKGICTQNKKRVENTIQTNQYRRQNDGMHGVVK